MSLSMFGLDVSVTGTSGVVETKAEFHATSASSTQRIRLVTVDGQRLESPRPVLDGYVEYLAGIGLSERTITAYSLFINRFWRFAESEGFDAPSVGALDLGLFTQTLPDSARRTHRSALKHWFESVGRMDAPLKAMRVPPKKRGVSRALEPHEASRLAHVAVDMEHPGGMAVLLGLYLGLRREEISKTRWNHFDADFEWFTFVGKLEIEATLPVHPVLKEAMLPNTTAFPSVFPGRATMHMSPGTIGHWVAKVGGIAGINKLSPHQLRHTAIATINDATGDLRMAQEFARHADVETTQIYTRVTKDRLLRAIDTLNYLDDEPAPEPAHHREDGST